MADVFRVLQNIFPAYLFPTIAALMIAGDGPFSTPGTRFFHILVCLGCPFIPLFLFLHVKSGVDEDGEEIPNISAYWLPEDKFRAPNCEENQFVNVWPFGFRVKSLDFSEVPDIRKRLTECIANISFLDYSSCYVAAYFIFVGILTSIYRAVGPCQEQDWPAIPLLLSWTLPILFFRIRKGKVVVKNPKKALKEVEGYIRVVDVDEHIGRDGCVLCTLLASITVHWIVVILTYYTKPVGFGCRSIGLAVIAGVWTFNSIISFRYYFLLSKPPPGVKDSVLSFWLCTSGVGIGAFFIFFGAISNNPSWWVAVFGNFCDVSSCLETGN